MVTQSQIQDLHKVITNRHAGVQRKFKYLEEHQRKIDLVSDNVKVDFSVIRDETAPLGLRSNRENNCFFNSVIRVATTLGIQGNQGKIREFDFGF